MKEAVQEVLNGKSTRSVAKARGLSLATLGRYVKKTKSNSEGLVSYTPNYKTCQIFHDELEKCMVEYIIKCAKISMVSPMNISK